MSCHNESDPFAAVKRRWTISPCHRSPNKETGSIRAWSDVDHADRWLHVLVDKWPAVRQLSHIKTFQEDPLELYWTFQSPRFIKSTANTQHHLYHLRKHVEMVMENGMSDFHSVFHIHATLQPFINTHISFN